MQNMGWKLGLIALVLAMCMAGIMLKDLRLGKDLRGGVSLVYQVDIEEGETNAQEILARVIAVLKDRVNPKGVFDISMQPMGRDRIEIVMPLPDATVRALAKDYRSALDTLLEKAEIPPLVLDEELRNGTAAQDLGGDPTTDRGRLMGELQTAYDAMKVARDAYFAARDRGDDEATLNPLAFDAGEKEGIFEELRDEVLDLSLGEPRVRRAMSLPTTPLVKKDEAGEDVRNESGDVVMGPSQREEALAQLKREYGHLAADLDAAVAAFDGYRSKSRGLDDPEDLKRLLRGAGVLEFRIALLASDPGVDVDGLRADLMEGGPNAANSPRAGWYPINELKQWYETPLELQFLQADPINFFASRRDLVAAEYEGTYYLLLSKRPDQSITHADDKPWSLTKATRGVDSFGRPCVNFTLDEVGGMRMARLTGGNLSSPMAIVLDGEVYSAPNIQSQIAKSGQITGSFSEKELAYLNKTLSAGSLQAQLRPDPISESVLGPTIGADNLRRGRTAFIVAIIAVAIFMVFYYFFAGLVAVVALAANGIIIFGVMMGIDGVFTLPGLAGIILTIGMAVDANVLIYERIREEIFEGELDVRGAVRQGYAKALSTIIDGNITNLIVCFVLFQTATTEVKGFALTLTVGICATLFTALFLTRQIFYLYTDVLKARKLDMLPTVFPAIHRALEPSINWIALRKIFWTFSAIALVTSVLLIGARGVDLFDTEFRGGVSLTMVTAIDPAAAEGDDEPARLRLRHTGTPDSVLARVRAIGEAADPESATTDEERARLAVLAELENAAVLTVGETDVDEDGNVVSERFQVKVSNPRGIEGIQNEDTITVTVVEAIVSAFGDQLDATRPLHFAGAGADDARSHVFPITERELGPNIQRPNATDRIPTFVGGAAIVLEDVNPPATTADIAARVDRMRNQPDFQACLARDVLVIGLTPATDKADAYTDLVVLVQDQYKQYGKIDTEVWFSDVSDAEWELVSRALTQPASLEQISTFSSAVASTLSAQAIVAVVMTLLGILVYIWVRFGSLRYSLAAIVALVHDVTIALGILALSAFIGSTAIGRALLIEPFRIDLGVVAALLTIIGYSLNDTIVILDRIRENRGKLPLPTAPIVNRSINQTVSRTLLTSVTTIVAVLIMYVIGGAGIRPFTFVLLSGLIVGTYSSIAIAAPLVFTGSAGGKATKSEPQEASALATAT